jgi:hypothetical protein
LGFFDEVEVAESLIPEPERSQFDLYAYELLDQPFAGGCAESWAVPQLASKPPGSASIIAVRHL